MGDAKHLQNEQLRALDRLASTIAAKGDFYLAGGSGVAFHLGHRRSVDIDLFSRDAGADLDPFRDLARRDAQQVQVLGRTDAMIRLLVEGVPADIVRYPYPLLEPPADAACGVPVASLRDLGAMKLAAVAKRGVRRDFWDLYSIVQHGHTLPQLGDAYIERFGVAEGDLYHIWRSLTFYDDAEQTSVMPSGMTRAMWEDIKNFFRSQAAQLV